MQRSRRRRAVARALPCPALVPRLAHWRTDSGPAPYTEMMSASVEQLAMVAYVPANEFNKSAEKVDVTTWMTDVCAKVGAEIVKPAFDVVSMIPDPKSGALLTGTKGKITGKVVVAVAKSNPEAGKFALKDKDAAMAAAFAYLRSVGAFPEDNGDDSDEMVFGDDDNLDDY